MSTLPLCFELAALNTARQVAARGGGRNHGQHAEVVFALKPAGAKRALGKTQALARGIRAGLQPVEQVVESGMDLLLNQLLLISHCFCSFSSLGA